MSMCIDATYAVCVASIKLSMDMLSLYTRICSHACCATRPRARRAHADSIYIYHLHAEII